MSKKCYMAHDGKVFNSKTEADNYENGLKASVLKVKAVGLATDYFNDLSAKGMFTPRLIAEEISAHPEALIKILKPMVNTSIFSRRKIEVDVYKHDQFIGRFSTLKQAASVIGVSGNTVKKMYLSNGKKVMKGYTAKPPEKAEQPSE